MASTDATPLPVKNQAYRVTFPIFDADGDLVTGATGLDSEVSKDAGTFADCTNEATEIATNSGMYYLDLTNTEMNADTVAIIVKTTSSGAKTTPIVMYPAESTDIPVNVTALSGDATAADNAEAFFDGTGYAGTNNVIPTVTTATNVTTVNGLAANVITATSIAADAITAAKIADGAIDAGAFAADAITAAKIADGAIDAATFASGAINAAAIAADAITAAKIADGAIDAATFAAGAINAAAIATDAITAAKIAADAIGASELAADAVTEIQSGLATAANLSTVAGYIDTEVAAIKTVTDAIGTTGSGLSAIPWNSAWDAEVQSEVDDALVAQNLDHLVKIAVDTDFATTVHLNSVVGHLADNGSSATFDRTTDSLEALQAEHDATQSAVNTVDDFLDTEIGAIKAVTDALPNSGALTTIQADLDDIQTRLPAALVSGRMDSNVQAMATGVITATVIAADAIGASELAADAVTEIQSGLATAAALSTLAGYVDTEVAAIKAVTDNLPNSGALTNLDAAVSTRATPAQVNSEVLDVLTVDTFAEPSAVPAATSTIKDKLNWLFALARNKRTTTATTDTLRNDADNGNIATAGVSDDGATFTRNEYS